MFSRCYFKLSKTPEVLTSICICKISFCFLIAKYDRAVFVVVVFFGEIIKQPKIQKFVHFTFIHLLKSL